MTESNGHAALRRSTAYSEPSLFDANAGEAARDEGATAALEADTTLLSIWRGSAKIAVLALADEGREFSADDIVAQVGPPPAGRHNALGGLFLWAHNSGFIRAVGYRRGERPSAHARVQRTWVGRANVTP